MAPAEATRGGEKRPVFLWAVLCLALFSLFPALRFSGPPEETWNFQAGLLETVLSLALALLVFWTAFRQPAPRWRNPWLLLALAFLAYGLGDVLASLFRVPLVAGGGASVLLNVLYLAFYPLFLAGVLRLPHRPLGRGERLRLFLDLGVVALAGALGLWIFVVEPRAFLPQNSAAAAFLAVAYPLGDVVLLWALLRLLFRRGDAAERTSYRLLALSAALLILTDFFYSLFILAGEKTYADFVSLGYMASHALAGFSALLFPAPPPSAPEERAGPAEDPALLRTSVIVAYGALLLALLALFASSGGALPLLAFVALLLMVVLGFVRQMAGLAEIRRLTEALDAERAALEERVQARTADLRRAVDELAGEVAQRQKAEEALQASEQRFRDLVQQSHDLITVHGPDCTILYESPSVGRILGYGPGGLLGGSHFDKIHPQDEAGARRMVAEMLEGRVPEKPFVFRMRHADGHYVYLEALANNQLDNPAIGGIVFTTREVTERVRAEKALQQQVRELRALSRVASLAVDASDERALLAGFTAVVQEELYPDNCGVLLLDAAQGALVLSDSYARRDRSPRFDAVPLGQGVTGRVAATGKPLRIGDVRKEPGYIAMDPAVRSELCVPLLAGGRILGVVNVESARENRFSEHDQETLSTLAGFLATALERLRSLEAVRESEERFRRLSEAAFEGVCISDQGRVVDANPRLAQMTGYSLPEILGKPVLDFLAPSQRDRAAAYLETFTEEPFEFLFLRRDGSEFPVECRTRPLPFGGRTVRVTAVRDITERKRTEMRVRRQVERLSALRTIDAAISASLDLKTVLSTFLEQAVARLEVDAAAILLLDPVDQTLEFAASRGFRTDALRHTHLQLGQCFAGRAALTRRRVRVEDLKHAPEEFARSPLFLSEDFRAYFAVPLLSRGQVKGVLEVFHRTYLDPDAEWLDFLDTLAGQAAIAVDNVGLFENLQKTNLELASAYETTLEGWSRALELRDQETQGHTLRVAELTVRLARALSLPESEMAHIRRGALLHDIGKMGIPDAILLKPGPLTEAEWTVMKRHTEYAADLLGPIEFLRPALDIPTCHHERWDGKGYPRGLQGEEIPLAARIFSVVDSYDALSSDRPYRKAWPPEKVQDYLQEEAGRRFDPAVVAVFLDLLKRKE